MKKILALAPAAVFVTAILFITTALLNSCGEASKKDVKNANENIVEASEDLKKAVTDANEETKRKAIANWQKFRNESDSSIAAIDNQVHRLKENIAKINNKEKEKLKGELNKLEQKLLEEKEELDQKRTEFELDQKEFNESVVTKYESFKREFKHDTDELGTALKDLFKDNVK